MEQGIKDAGYTTTAQIREALEEKLVLKTDAQKQNSALYDVKLKIKDDTAAGGWRDATSADIESFGPIAVEIDYPSGTNGMEYIFKVAHMIGTTTGKVTAGTIETPGVSVGEYGIRTAFQGVSPILISWTTRSVKPNPGPDVSLEVHYLEGGYKGAKKTFTIPKGTDTVKLLDKNGYAGFLFLDGKY